MPFLNHRDYENLPDDDEEAFSYLVSLIDERVKEAETDNYGNLSFMTIGDYMNEVTALANQFGIPDINFTPPDEDYQSQYNNFQWSVQARLTRFRVVKSRRDTRLSVEVAGPTRQRIQHYLEKLKAEITKANLDQKRVKALLERIKDLELELAGGKRVNLAIVMAVVALTLQAAHDAGDILLDARKYAGAISQLIGSEKVKEPDALPHARPKRIEDQRPSPKKSPATPRQKQQPSHEDDAISPFHRAH